MNFNKALSDNVTDPLLLLASGDPETGPAVGEYGPLQEAIYYLSDRVSHQGTSLYLIRLLVALNRAEGERLSLILEWAIHYALLFSDQFDQSIEEIIRKIESGEGPEAAND